MFCDALNFKLPSFPERGRGIFLKKSGTRGFSFLHSWFPIVMTVLFLSNPAQASNAEKRFNPFLLPDGVYVRSQIKEVETVEVSAPDIKLQAVLSINGTRVATLNNKNYVEGDRIFGKTVLEISKSYVILQDDSGQTVLDLNRPPFKVKVVDSD